MATILEAAREGGKWTREAYLKTIGPNDYIDFSFAATMDTFGYTLIMWCWSDGVTWRKEDIFSPFNPNTEDILAVDWIKWEAPEWLGEKDA